MVSRHAIPGTPWTASAPSCFTRVNRYSASLTVFDISIWTLPLEEDKAVELYMESTCDLSVSGACGEGGGAFWRLSKRALRTRRDNTPRPLLLAKVHFFSKQHTAQNSSSDCVNPCLSCGQPRTYPRRFCVWFRTCVDPRCRHYLQRLGNVARTAARVSLIRW